MTYKMKMLILWSLFAIVGSVFTLNCNTNPAEDGPSCTNVDGLECKDLISTDLISVLNFESDCRLGDTYSTEGCDLSTYNLSGYCEIIHEFNGYTYAEYYYNLTIDLALAGCTSVTNSTWVNY